jgi:hypothetical protein
MRDPIVEQVRQARAAYAAQFDHDLDRIVDDLKRRQDQGEFTVVRRSPRPVRKVPRPRSKRSA